MQLRWMFMAALATLAARADAQPKKAPPKAPEPALYDLDTAAAPAPAANSALDRVLKSLHVRACVRADVAPFGDFAANGLEGLDIELASEIAKQISIDYKQALKVEWNVVAVGDRIKRVQDGACDILVAALSHTPERAQQIGLSKVYLRTDKVLLAAASVKRKVPVVGKLKSATGDSGIPGTIREFNTYTEIIHAMDMDELDYLATDRPIAEQLIRSSVKSFKVEKTLAADAESYVVGVPSGSPELLAAVNKALDDLARTGRLALLHRRWL